MATVPVSKTWVDGVVTTKADLDAQTKTSWEFFLDKPFCKVERASSVQSIAASGSHVAISFDTEVEDNDGMYSAGSPTRITIQTDGLYLVQAHTNWAVNVNNNRLTSINKNGIGNFVAFHTRPADSTDSCTQIWWLGRLVAGNYLELGVRQTTVGAVNTGTGTGIPTMSVKWMAAL
jgi:hypothetical protein